MSETSEPAIDTKTAETVVVSYPRDLSDWGRMRIDDRRFRAYLRKVYDDVTAGDAWEEFVGVGCCGNTLDVPLRVERVDGGSRMGEDTVIEFEERAACGLAGNWRVQSAAGPKSD